MQEKPNGVWAGCLLIGLVGIPWFWGVIDLVTLFFSHVSITWR